MDYNALHCRNCGATIDSRDVHEDLAIAKCRYCNTVMDLARRGQDDDASRPDRPAATARPRERPAVPIPERFKVDQQGGKLTIEWRWFNATFIFLLFFCAFWDSFLVIWYLTAMKSGDAPSAVFVFPLIHVTVGLGLTWYTLAGLLNRTRIEVEQGTLRIRHFPLPWPGNRELSVGDLSQLFCDESVHRNKNSTTYTYNLNAMLRSGGRKLKLIGRLEKPELALYLEQKLESHLGIRDVPVQGELSK